ncbi:MAG TPA: hypothetical protein ACFYD3_07245 [Candidatus Hypogeohydataceae bacterium YC41]
MAEISVAQGFRNEQVILTQVERILKEMRLDGRLSNVHVKHPPAEAQIDNNYLRSEGLLKLEVVDSLGNLEGRLRHELMHVFDQIDEAFGYRAKDVPKAGTAELRRYKYLWNVYIDSRLIKAEKPAYASYYSREDEMGECWPELSEDTRKELFDYLWNLSDKGSLTQKQLIQLSNDVFKFSKDLKAKSKARGEKLRKFKTLEELKHFAEWGDVHE